jgi:hypothetical protein
MGHRVLPILLCSVFVSVSSAWADPAQRVPPQQSPLDVPQSPRWCIGAEGLREARDLFMGNDAFQFDAWHLDAVVGVQPFSWLLLQAGAGATEVTRDTVDSDIGPEWLARIKANIAEYVFTTQPGVGRHQVLRLGALASYRDAKASFDDSVNDGSRYYKWQEWLIEPYLQYTVNLLGPGNWDSLDVAAVALRAGPAFSWVNGRFNSTDIDEQHSYGIAVGGDMLLAGGLTLGVDARTYGSGDGSVGVSLGHRF